MFITLIKTSDVAAEDAADYEQLSARMAELATSLPGFIEAKSYTGEDGESLSIIRFADEASHEAWRTHPEHQQAMKLGRDRFYASFKIEVCEVKRTREFSRQAS